MYLYITSDLQRLGVFADASLAATTERHHINLASPPLQSVVDLSAQLLPATAAGAVFELQSGLPTSRQLQLIEQALGAGCRAWVYWPAEQAIECVDHDRLAAFRHHLKAVRWLKRICVPIDTAVTRWDRAPTGLRWIYRGEFPVRRSDILIKLTLLSLRAQPVAPANGSGVGVYLRTDFWHKGPDDERMRCVVTALGTTGGRIVGLTPRHDALLSEAGVQQVVMDPPPRTLGEDAIVLAPTHYWPIVKAVCQALGPAYLYDRLSAGQSVGAELSQLLEIPYIVEYRGAGACVREALGEAAPFYPELYSQAEELALRQATAIVVVESPLKDELIARGIDGSRILVVPCLASLGSDLVAFLDSKRELADRASSIDTGDSYKDRVQDQWNQNPVGSQHARRSQPHTLEWFLEVERHRYGVYAPWMPTMMEFADHAGHEILEIGGGIGTDLAQFAAHGASVTDVDLAAGHLQLAEEGFRLRGLVGRFIHHDAETLPFADNSFDLVYSNGVLHHTPNTAAGIGEIHRVLRPGGRAIVMVYAENSLHFWRKLVWLFGVQQGLLERFSMGEIMSRSVERSANEARPLVKVYTKGRLARLFKDFADVTISQRQLVAGELPFLLQWTLPLSERLVGWNLIVKATKPPIGQSRSQ